MSLCHRHFCAFVFAWILRKPGPGGKKSGGPRLANVLRKLFIILGTHISIQREKSIGVIWAKMPCCCPKNDRERANSRMSWTCVPPADLNLERRVNRMLSPFTSPPSITATSVRCPQCGEQMYIKLVVPDPTFSTKEKHTFECGECGLVRTFTMKLSGRHNKARPPRRR